MLFRLYALSHLLTRRIYWRNSLFCSGSDTVNIKPTPINNLEPIKQAGSCLCHWSILDDHNHPSGIQQSRRSFFNRVQDQGGCSNIACDVFTTKFTINPSIVARWSHYDRTSLRYMTHTNGSAIQDTTDSLTFLRSSYRQKRCPKVSSGCNIV